MDTNALAHRHRAEWDELEALARRRDLTPAQADRLISLYQWTGTHLAALRGGGADPALVEWLSALLARVRRRALTPRRPLPSAVARFFTHELPGALYATRRWWLGTMAAGFALIAAMTWYYLAHPEVESRLLSAAQVESLVSSDFAGYYTEYAATDFALSVWTNNAWLAAQAIALGFLGLPVVVILVNNALNVGLTAAIMIHHGRADVFFGLILPHGLLELTAVFVAGGVGLRVFWSWVRPGDLPRAAAFAAAGRGAMTLVLGLAAVLGVTGVIEAFVTPSPLPTWARIGVGVLAEVAFFAYVWTRGPASSAAGHVGDVEAAVRRGAQEVTRA